MAASVAITVHAAAGCRQPSSFSQLGYALPGSDFEDNIQMAAAAAAGLDFVTCAMEPVLAIASSVAPAPHHLTGWRQAIQRASAVAAMRGGLIGLPQRLA